MTQRNRADAPADLNGYSVTMWQATGRPKAELDLIEGFVMDMIGPTLNHHPRETLISAAREAEAYLVSTGELPASGAHA